MHHPLNHFLLSTMKIYSKIIFFILFFLPALFFAETSFGQRNFKNLQPSTDSSYGYTKNNPLPMKVGKYSNRVNTIFEFLSRLKTKDNQNLRFLWRTCYSDSFLDEYVLVTTTTKDTINIFTDIKKAGKLMLPVGLKYEKPLP